MKIVFVKNIPSPYRNSFFSFMHALLGGVAAFEVWFMAKSEPNRHWQLHPDGFRYKHEFVKGFHPEILGMYAHINPSLLWKLRACHYDVLIVGGFGAPSFWLAPLFAKKGVMKILWSESNVISSVHNKGLGFWLKNALVRTYDAYLVPGVNARNYIVNICHKAREKPFILLPNLIEENIYVHRVNEARVNKASLLKKYGAEGARQVWLISAQLKGSKGVGEFLNVCRGLKGIKIFVAGSGPLRELLEKLVRRHDLNVEFLSHIQEAEMVELYALADLFVLPSLKDPSPLSVIEALASGLPILVSNKIGNLPEVLVEGQNGWSFDPGGDEDQNKLLIEDVSRLNQADLAAMGLISRKMFYSNFDAKKVVMELIKGIERVQNNG